MLFLRLETTVSGYQRKRYMTNAQLKLANTGHALSEILARASLETIPDSGSIPGAIESLARDSITRAKT